jgi:hypothetical protein
MATQTPSTIPPGILWQRFVDRHPTHAAKLQNIAHTSPPETFKKDILALIGTEASADDFDALLTDVQALKASHKGDHTEKQHEETEEQHEGKLEAMHESSQQAEEAIGVAGGALSFLVHPKINFMEEDPEFWKLVEKEKEKWQKDNPEPDHTASDDEKLAYAQKQLDFEYGSLDDPESASAEKLARSAFEKEYKQEEKQKEIAQDPNTQEKIDQKKLAKWNKYEAYRTTPTTFDKDAEIHHVKSRIEQEAQARYQLLQQKGLKGTELDQNYKAVMERIKQKHWEEFVERHQSSEGKDGQVVMGKADAYAKQVYTNKDKHAQEDFAAFQKAHEAVAAKRAERQGQVSPKTTITETDTNTSIQAHTPPSQPTPPVPPQAHSPSSTAVLSDDEKLVQKLAEMKREQSQRPPNIQQPKGRMAGNNPSGTGQKLTGMKTPPPPTHSPSSQGMTRPGAFGSSNQPKGSFPSQGTVRPGASVTPRFSFPRSRAPQTRGIQRPLRTAGMDRLNSGISSVGNTIQNAANTIKNVKNIASLLRTFAMFTNPTALVIIGIIILIILYISLFAGYTNLNITATPPEPTPATTTSPTTIPGLTLTLTGPTAVPNSENISYTIEATYTGDAEVTLSDPLPPDSTFVSATGTYTNEGNTTIWKLAENDGGDTSPKKYTFTIVLHPEKEDVIIRNKIIATATGGTNLPPNATATDFDTLMRGQGRNTTIMGDENTFVAQTVTKDGRLRGQENAIRRIYQAAIARNVNPLVILTLYGEEAGFASNNNTQFGCKPFGSGFEKQLACSVATWDNWMKYFDEHKDTSGQVSLGGGCVYSDPFLFAAEKYGPRCVVNDNNDHFTKNFVSIFKQLLN